MPNRVTSSGIRDNHKRGAVADFLKAKIHSGSRLSVVSVFGVCCWLSYERCKRRSDNFAQSAHDLFVSGVASKPSADAPK